MLKHDLRRASTVAGSVAPPNTIRAGRLPSSRSLADETPLPQPGGKGALRRPTTTIAPDTALSTAPRGRRISFDGALDDATPSKRTGPALYGGAPRGPAAAKRISVDSSDKENSAPQASRLARRAVLA